MLREIQAENNPRDLAEEYIKSPDYAALKQKLREVKIDPSPSMKIAYSSKFAAPADVRQKMMNKRLQTVYWRSPAYNLSRLLVSVIIAFILGSVTVADRNPDVATEADVRAWLSVIFLSFIIIGILSITSVLPVMLKIRDIFYRHRAAGMLDNISLGWALGTAEKWFIVLASFFFCLVFISVSGFTSRLLKRSIRFWVSAFAAMRLLSPEGQTLIYFSVVLGNFHLQSGDLLLFWPIIHVSRQQHAHGSNPC
jgi:hypothetical protein